MEHIKQLTTIKEIIQYTNNNEDSLKIDHYYHLAHKLIENYELNYNEFIERIIDKLINFEKEQSFNLSIRLYICMDKHEAIMQLFKIMIDKNISIRKRTISPLVIYAYNTMNQSFNLFLYNLCEEKEIILDEIDYYHQLSLFYKYHDYNHFNTLFSKIILIIDIFSENTARLLSTYFKESNLTTIHKTTNRCEHCKHLIKQHALSELQKDTILDTIKTKMAHNNPKFLDFIKNIDHISGYTYVLDGANIGYFKHRPDKGNVLSFKNINIVVEYLISKNKKPIIFLNKRHLQTKNKNNQQIINSWKSKNMLYITDRGLNDDWYWLYYSISNSYCKVITNDMMCDHYYELLHQKYFKNWRELHTINYDIVENKIKLNNIKPYLNQTQKKENRYHIPYLKNDIIKWLCVNKIILI